MIKYLALSIAWPTLCLAQEELVIATSGDNSPYILASSDGELAGLDYDLMQELCSRLAVDCVWQIAPIRELVPGVQSGQFDLAVGGIGTSAEREAIVDFTCWYDWTDDHTATFVGLRDGLDPRRDRIGVLEGSLDAEALVQYGYDAQLFDTKHAMLDSLLSGEIDLYFGFKHYINSSPLMDGTPTVNYETVFLGRTGAAIMVSEDRPDLRQALDQHLAEMVQNGALGALRRDWLGLDPQPFECQQTNLHS